MSILMQQCSAVILARRAVQANGKLQSSAGSGWSAHPFEIMSGAFLF